MAKTVTVRSRARIVCVSCSLADTIWARLRGLMGRRGLEPGEGLLLRPAGSVHTCFMRFPIDVVFMTAELEVVAVSAAVKPWRARARRGARAALELPAGTAHAAGLRAGDRLTLVPTSPAEYKEQAHALN
jgi:uncharacterized membrane protein (UPF0127 family)